MGGLLRSALTLFVLLMALSGVVYPAAVTLLAQTIFPRQANGSLIERDGRMVGSDLIGQQSSFPGYFWSRPSATSPAPYNAASSTGSNLGPSNPALVDAVAKRVAALRIADPQNMAPVPVDLVTASASGLDPHISIAAARYQAARVARARGVDVSLVDSLIKRVAAKPVVPGFGEPVVNVLKLNLALDKATQ